MAKVKVKVLHPYKDLQKKLLFYPGEVHEVEKVRAEELAEKNLVEIVQEKTTLKKETEQAP